MEASKPVRPRIKHTGERNSLSRPVSSTLHYKDRESRTPYHDDAPFCFSNSFVFANRVDRDQHRSFRQQKSMPNFAKLLIVIGAVLLVAGLALTVLGRTNLPLGRLPGDIVYRGKNTTFYFPLATSLLVSLVLSVALYVLSRFGR